jgi:hypothetical protein
VPGARPAKRPAKPSGARESNAGDDFHILWTARRCLRLLDGRSDLQAVFIEGVAEEDVYDDDLVLGADLSEYYGGEDFPSAVRVTVSQLKYSVRHRSVKWTIARLIEKRGRTSSVVGRLGEVVRNYMADGLAEVASKLRVSLVSNQEAGDDLVELLRAAKSGWDTGHVGSAAIDEKLRRDYDRLMRASGLDDTWFRVLLRIFTIEDCGAEARAVLEVELFRDIGRHLGPSVSAGFNALYHFISQMAQPEARGLKIDRRLIHPVLGVASEGDLFPAPPRFEFPTNAIATKASRHIADAIVAADQGRILVQGGSGVGKTTALLASRQLMPAGSVFVAFDCFGLGQSSSWSQRNSRTNVLIQIANEVAVSAGTPLLLAPNLGSLIREFETRLKAAAEVVEAEGGLLVIAIDAADNAAIANLENAEPALFPGIWEVDLPRNARLVVSTRLARRHLVLPDDHLRRLTGLPVVEVEGFTADESAINLRSLFPEVTDQESTAFHAASRGNPRIQFYALASGPSDVSAAIAAAAKVPGDLFADLYKTALQVDVQPGRMLSRVCELACLARPTPIPVLAAVWDEPPEEARRIVTALEPGIVIDGDEVTIRDEDFESYLRDKFSEKERAIAHVTLGERFYSERGQDAYAARVVASHLFLGGKGSELASLADEPVPTRVVPDPLARRFIERDRVKFALQAAARVGPTRESLRLLARRAETVSSGNALTEVVRLAPELAAAYADPESVASIYVRHEAMPWMGPARLKMAAFLARSQGADDVALEQLRQAQDWLRLRFALPSDEVNGWILKASDIAAGAEAVYWLRGPAEAAEWLYRWRPARARASAFGDLADQLASNVDPATFEQQILEFAPNPMGTARGIAALWRAGRTPTMELVTSCLDQLARHGRLRKLLTGSDWTVDLAEAVAAALGGGSEHTRLALTMVADPPKWVPSAWTDLGPWVGAIRARCLAAALSGDKLTDDALLPESARAKNDGFDSGDVRRFNELVLPLQHLYELRAHALIEPVEIESVVGHVQEVVRKRSEAASHRRAQPDHGYAAWAQGVARLALACAGDCQRIVDLAADAAEKVTGHGAARLWIGMAKRLVHDPRARQSATALIDRAWKWIERTPMSASSKTELLLQAATVTSMTEPGLARDLFNAAMEAADGLDDESSHFLDAAATIAAGRGPESERSDGRALANQLADVADALAPFVSNDEVFPTQKVLLAALRLDLPSGVALAARWDDEDRLSLAKAAEAVALELCAQQALSPGAALEVLRMSDPNGGVATALIDLLDRSVPEGREATAELLTESSHWLLRDTPRGYTSAAAALVRWAESKNFSDAESVAALRDYAQFIQGLPRDADGPTERPDASTRSHSEDADAEPQDGDESMAAAVKKAVRRSGDKALREYLSRRRQHATTPAERIAYLDGLAELEPDVSGLLSYSGTFIDAMRESLDGWFYSPSIQAWTTRGVARFIDHQLHAVLRHNWEPSWLRNLISLPTLGSAPADAVLRVVARDAEMLDPSEILAVVSELGQASSDRLGLTRDLLARIELHLTPSLVSRPALPQNPLAALAAFFWAMAGHPDREIRSQATHSLARIAPKLHPEFLAEFVARLRNDDAGSFLSPRHRFYAQSAKVAGLLGLDWISRGDPASVRPHLQTLISLATDPSWPHAQGREVAKRAALRIVEAFPDDVSSETMARLRGVNTPVGFRRERRHARVPNDRETGWRFDFDSWDTLHYWYEPLADVFGVPQAEVTRRAERWIVDVWKANNDSWWTDPRELRDNSYRYTHNDHGTTPRIEIMRTYLEYHAMQLAAGEMVDSLPVERKGWDPTPWRSWLDDQLDTSPDWILADLRSPTPLYALLHGRLEPVVGGRRVPDSYFDQFLELRPARGDSIVVAAGLNAANSTERQWVAVDSALVAPDLALALVSALQSARDPSDYALPLKRTRDGFREHEIAEGPFVLSGWLEEHSRDRGRLDKFDPEARDLGYSFVAPSGHFLASGHLRVDATGLVIRTQEGDVRAVVRLWDEGRSDRDDGVGGSGFSVGVYRTALLPYLKKRRMDLLLTVKVFGYRRGSTSHEEERHEPGQCRAYVLRRDGRLIGLGRNVPAG